MKKPDPAALEHFLFREPAGALDRYQALLEEDQALRHAEYDRPDPKRRRLRVSCNACEAPWCCYQRVRVDLIEALVIYRWAVEHAPRELAGAIARGKSLHERPPLDESEFFRRRVGCPFLVKGKCAIFSVRPYQCRSHYMGGNPLKCRDELTPSETYQMSPDKGLIGELEAIAEDLKFEHLIGDVGPSELAEVLYFIDLLAQKKRWKALRTLDWDAVE